MDIQRLLSVWLFRVAVITILIELGWGLFWAMLDIGLRLGVWPEAYDFGMSEMLPTLSFTQEAIFFGSVSLHAMALIFLLNRNAWALPTFLVGFLLDRTDWVMLSMNPIENALYSDLLLRDLFFLANSMFALLCLAAMKQRGALRWKRPRTVSEA